MYIYFLGILIATLWGIAPVLQKKILNDITAETTMVILGVLYFIFICFFAYINQEKIRKDINKISKDQIKIILLISILGFIATLLYYHALSKETASKVVTITSIWPIFAVLFGTIILNEKFNSKLLIALFSILFLVNFLEN